MWKSFTPRAARRIVIALLVSATVAEFGLMVQDIPVVGCPKLAAASIHALKKNWWWGDSFDVQNGQLVYKRRRTVDAPLETFRTMLSCGELKRVLDAADQELAEEPHSTMIVGCSDHYGELTLTHDGKVRTRRIGCSCTTPNPYTRVKAFLPLPVDLTQDN